MTWAFDPSSSVEVLSGSPCCLAVACFHAVYRSREKGVLAEVVVAQPVRLVLIYQFVIFVIVQKETADGDFVSR